MARGALEFPLAGDSVRVDPGPLHSLFSEFWSGMARHVERDDDPVYAIRERGDFQFLRNNETVFQSPTRDRFLLTFEGWLIDQFTASVAPSSLLFHAGGVSRGNYVVLLVGGPGSGKTTAVHELLKCDLSFGTDEMVGYHPGANTLHWFSRPLSYTSRPTSEVIPSISLDGDERYWYGLPDPQRFVPARQSPEKIRLVLLDRGDYHADLTPVKPGEALVEWIQHLFRPREGEQRYRSATRWLSSKRTAPECYRAHYRDFRDLVDLVRGLLQP